MCLCHVHCEPGITRQMQSERETRPQIERERERENARAWLLTCISLSDWTRLSMCIRACTCLSCLICVSVHVHTCLYCKTVTEHMLIRGQDTTETPVSPRPSSCLRLPHISTCLSSCGMTSETWTHCRGWLVKIFLSCSLVFKTCSAQIGLKYKYINEA